MKNKSTILLVILGVILIGIVSFIVITSNATVKVWVPSQTITTGTQVTEDMLKQIDIPSKTPGNYIKDKSYIVGYRLKNTVDENQLFYASDFLSSWEKYNEDLSIPEDFAITAIQIPDSRAVGGLITAGDYVDILGVTTDSVLGWGNTATNGKKAIATYILANVRVINTNSALSESQDSGISSVTGSDGSGSYYIVALSYQDLKKVRQAEQEFTLWLNLVPSQNKDNDPLIQQMLDSSTYAELHDSSKVIFNKDGSAVTQEQVDQSKEAETEKTEKTENN
jgi:Flp pilus assembly protein CpaB